MTVTHQFEFSNEGCARHRIHWERWRWLLRVTAAVFRNLQRCVFQRASQNISPKYL